MLLTYELDRVRSIELFRLEIRDWNPNKLAVTARKAALNILSL
jgi:hypothetical protein